MSKKQKVKTKILKEEDEFKAVLIADSFDEKFGPLYLTKPKALFPLVTVPMIEYSLNALESSKFDEVYIITCHLSTQLREYINSSKWMSSSMKITLIPVDSCISIGDCLRDLDAKALIRNNFILIGADTVFNIPLKMILDDFKSKLANDKGSIMTVIMRKTSVDHATRSGHDDVIIFKDANTAKILCYQKAGPKVSLPIQLLKDAKNVDVCNDLVNSQICACSPVVLSLFSENFDYQTLDDFIKGIIMNEEILGHSIYLHAVEMGYVEKVTNLHMYSAVSYDIVDRWPYPFVPDIFTNLSYLRHNFYKGKGVILQRGCDVKDNVVLGQNTTVAENSILTNSVIGNNCKIGKNVKIDGAFIWDNVVVENDCEVLKSVLGENVIVRPKTVINEKCVIGSNVHIGPSVHLPEKTLISEKVQSDEFGNEDSVNKDYDVKLIGSKGHGYVYKLESQIEDGVDELNNDLWNVKISSDDEEDDLSSMSSRFSESEAEFEENEESPVHEDVRSFCEEVLDSLLRGVEENISSDNLILEINSSKYAYNITIQEVNTHVVSTILSMPLVVKSDLNVAEYFSKLRPLFAQFSPLLVNYIKNDESQMDCLNSIEDFMTAHPKLNGTTIKILHFLYEKDILSEDNIIKWNDNPKEDESLHVEKKRDIRKMISGFINWLKEAEEESD